MRPLLGLSLLAFAVAAPLAHAEPGGCLKYGAAGAVGGCATGMYKRHEFRKEAREKAALYDKEHPGAKGSYEEKATAYDVEHSTQPGKSAPSDAPATKD